MAAKSLTKAEQLLGTREGPRVEFKRAESLQRPENLLRPIVAFLNSGGGSLFLGVEEENGVATAVPGVPLPDKTAGRLMDLAADLVEPRPNLPAPKYLPTSTGAVVLEIKVPKGREVYALRRSASYQFPERVGDRIRHQGWMEILRKLGGPESGEGESAHVRTRLSEERTRFLQGRTGEPTLHLVIQPAEEREELLRRDDAEIPRALADVLVANNRYTGWTYEVGEPARRGRRRWEQGRADPPYRHMVVHESGRIEFTTAYGIEWIHHSLGAAEQNRQVMDPYVAVEYPASVLRLAGWLLERADYDGSIFLELVLRDMRGVELGPHHPTSIGFLHHANWKTCEEEDILVGPTGPIEVAARELVEKPDRVTYRLVREVYETFGYEEEKIPFYRRDSGIFVFP